MSRHCSRTESHYLGAGADGGRAEALGLPLLHSTGTGVYTLLTSTVNFRYNDTRYNDTCDIDIATKNPGTVFLHWKPARCKSNDTRYNDQEFHEAPVGLSPQQVYLTCAQVSDVDSKVTWEIWQANQSLTSDSA